MDRLFAPPAEPPTPLARLRVLSPHASVRMSALQFGGMSIGQAWAENVGEMNKEKAFDLLDAFVAAGGVSIDTANHYQDEESEMWIGEWMISRKNRDRLVLCTKYASCYQAHALGKNESANTTGNHSKSLHVSLRDSMQKLQTDYIDIFYVHWWDFVTSIEEMMDALDVQVKLGKILYLGASNLPAWLVAGENSYAKAHGKAQFVIYQGKWNVMVRDLEREIIPMARTYGMAIAPWAALGQGRLQSRKQMQQIQESGERFRSGSKGSQQTEEELQFSEVLNTIAERHGLQGVAPVALAYLFAKYPYTFPVVGFQNQEQLDQNISALTIHLTSDEVKEIDDVRPFDVGYPNDFLGPDPRVTGKGAGPVAVQVGSIDWLVERPVYASQRLH